MLKKVCTNCPHYAQQPTIKVSTNVVVVLEVPRKATQIEKIYFMLS